MRVRWNLHHLLMRNKDMGVCGFEREIVLSVSFLWGGGFVFSFYSFLKKKWMNPSIRRRWWRPLEYQVLRCGFDRKDDHKKPAKETYIRRMLLCFLFFLLFCYSVMSLLYKKEKKKSSPNYECRRQRNIFLYSNLAGGSFCGIQRYFWGTNDSSTYRI